MGAHTTASALLTDPRFDHVTGTAEEREYAPMLDRPSAERTQEIIDGIDPQRRYRAIEAAGALGIKPATLYAYRSRGQIAEPGEDKRWSGQQLIDHARARHQGAGGGRPEKEPTEGRVTMRISLPAELAEAVRVEAARRGTFPSMILEEAVTTWQAQQP